MNHFIVDGRYKDILEYHGINSGEVLKKAGLPGDILLRKTITMTEEQYYSFLDAIQTVGNVKGLAVKLSTTEKIEQFSPPIFASFCSKNARMCIERLAKYKKLIGPMEIKTEEADGKFYIEYFPGDPELELPVFLLETEFAFFINLFRRATKENITPVEINSRQEITDSSLEEYCGVKITTSEKNQIVFNSKDMDLPFITFNEGMWDYLEPEMNRRLSDLDVDDSFSARVRSTLTELLPTGISDIEEVAYELGLSKRTLQRKLSEENTTFQKQLNNTREILALHYIKNTDMTTNDIAFLLGYAELNSFLRAFVVWTGKNVSEFRKG